MSWWLATYLLLFVVISAAGISSDWRSKGSIWLVPTGTATLVLGTLCVCAFAYPEVRNTLGQSLWAIILLGVAAEVGLAISDLSEMRSEMTQMDLVATTVITALVALPAYLLGALAATR